MAYISSEKVAEMRNKIRKEFPNFKFSIRRLHSIKVSVQILEGDANFYQDFKYKENIPSQDENNMNLQVNHIHIDKNFTGKSREVLNKIKHIITSTEEYYDMNFGDRGADYFDYTFYYSIEIGRYDKPYVLKENNRGE